VPLTDGGATGAGVAVGTDMDAAVTTACAAWTRWAGNGAAVCAVGASGAAAVTAPSTVDAAASSGAESGAGSDAADDANTGAATGRLESPPAGLAETAGFPGVAASSDDALDDAPDADGTGGGTAALA
jgi:hypothetical protein